MTPCKKQSAKAELPVTLPSLTTVLSLKQLRKGFFSGRNTKVLHMLIVKRNQTTLHFSVFDILFHIASRTLYSIVDLS